jgi:hypothetical protein
MKIEKIVFVKADEVEQFLKLLGLEANKETKISSQLQEYLNEHNLGLKDIKISRLIGGKVWLVLQKGTSEVELLAVNGKLKVVLPL